MSENLDISRDYLTELYKKRKSLAIGNRLCYNVNVTLQTIKYSKASGALCGLVLWQG